MRCYETHRDAAGFVGAMSRALVKHTALYAVQKKY